MPSYTVVSVGENPRQWGDPPNGPFLDYSVRFKEHPGEDISWSRKLPSNGGKIPSRDDVVEGTIDWQAKFGPKFKQEYANRGGGGGGGTWKPRDPSETAAIQRQHSQEMALRYAGIHPGAGQKMINTSGVAALEEIIKPLIDWFQRDVEAGVKLAEKDNATKASYGQAKDTTELTGVSDVPAPAPQEFQAPEPEQDSLDSIPF